MEHHRRHAIIWRLMQPLIRLFGRVFLRFRGEPAEVTGPYLAVCNHVTDFDPVLMACSFREQMYYVASEHLMRSGLAGRFVSWAQAPIARQKGGSAADTVMSILRHLKKGYNVAFFPEGNRSWDGVTGEFLPSTGKLARTAAASGASLVTYRLTGGYLASPRWAGAAMRRGKMRGEPVHIYSPAELRAMKPEEINAAIAADLHEDCWAAQREAPVEYRGRRLAEHLETLFFLCPKCGAVHALRSEGDRLTCSACGLTVRFLPTGFVTGEGLAWDNLRDWNLWQQSEIRRLCDEAEGDAVIFSDGDMRTLLVDKGRRAQELGRGEMALRRDRLELPGLALPLSEITGIALRGAQDIYFGTRSGNYQVVCHSPRCTVRYLTAISHINGVTYGV